VTDLSGRWCGIFDYPSELPATAFTADLRDAAGVLTGMVEEPDILRSGHIAIRALISGRRDGAPVRFVKYCEVSDSGYDSVDNAGTVQPTGTRSAGASPFRAYGQARS
jgi:hypothetical protein